VIFFGVTVTARLLLQQCISPVKLDFVSGEKLISDINQTCLSRMATARIAVVSEED